MDPLAIIAGVLAAILLWASVRAIVVARVSAGRYLPRWLLRPFVFDYIVLDGSSVRTRGAEFSFAAVVRIDLDWHVAAAPSLDWSLHLADGSCVLVGSGTHGLGWLLSRLDQELPGFSAERSLSNVDDEIDGGAFSSSACVWARDRRAAPEAL